MKRDDPNVHCSLPGVRHQSAWFVRIEDSKRINLKFEEQPCWPVERQSCGSSFLSRQSCILCFIHSMAKQDQNSRKFNFSERRTRVKEEPTNMKSEVERKFRKMKPESQFRRRAERLPEGWCPKFVNLRKSKPKGLPYIVWQLGGDPMCQSLHLWRWRARTLKTWFLFSCLRLQLFFAFSRTEVYTEAYL